LVGLAFSILFLVAAFCLLVWVRLEPFCLVFQVVFCFVFQVVFCFLFELVYWHYF